MSNLIQCLRKHHSYSDLGFYLSNLYFFVFLPILVAFFNPNDSEFSIIEILIMGAGISGGLSLVYCMVVATGKVPENLKKFFIALALFLFVVLIFFPTTTGMIDGFKKDYSLLDSSVLWDLGEKGVIFVVLLGLVFYSQQSASFAQTMLSASVIFALLFISYAVISGFFGEDNNKKLLWKTFQEDMQDKAAFHSFGKEQNVIVILWDAIEGKIVENLFKGNSKALEQYQGFTFFPEAIGPAPLTWRVLPSFYSGKFQMYHGENKAVIQKIMYSDSFFADAKQNGFHVAAKGHAKDLRIGGFENYSSYLSDLENQRKALLEKYVFFLLACQKRISPLFLQRSIDLAVNYIRQKKFAKGNKGDSLEERALYNYISQMKEYFQIDKFHTGDFASKLLYFHPNMTHEPYCDEQGYGYSQKKAEYAFSCALHEVTPAILEKLKQLKIYDESLIFIISDHGSRVPETSQGIKVGDSALDLSYTGISRYPASSYNPLIMVKKPHAQGAMKISYAPAMLTDIRKVIQAYLKGREIEKEKLFQLKSSEQRKIQLILTTNPQMAGTFPAHTFLEFQGTLKDVARHFKLEK